MNMKQNLQQSQVKQTEKKEEKQPEVHKADVKQDDKIQEEQNKLKEEAAHWKDLALRATAEMENLKKRTQIDIEKANRYATASFAKELLPVADCMEQALTYAKTELERGKNPVLENLSKGIEMTLANLVSALKKQKIEKMQSIGLIFDPNLHKVIQEVENKEKPAGTILQELQSGYTIGGDRVLREAMVIVSK